MVRRHAVTLSSEAREGIEALTKKASMIVGLWNKIQEKLYPKNKPRVADLFLGKYNNSNKMLYLLVI